MKSYLIIVFGILIFSCNESENERKSYIKKNIIGKWCGFGGIKPILDFTSDSIKNDTLTFFDDLPEPIKAIKLKD